MKHRNDIFDWILEQKFSDNEQINDLKNLIYQSACQGNAHSLIEIIDKGFNLATNKEVAIEIIQASAANGFCLLTQLILNIVDKNILNDVKLNPETLIFDNLSIISLFQSSNFIENRSKFNTNLKQIRSLMFAVDNNLMCTIKYFFELTNQGVISFESLDIFELLKRSIQLRNNTLFNYIIDQIKLRSLNLFKR